MLKLYSLFDRKAGFFNEPRVYRSNAEATRAFQAAVNDPKSGSLFSHSADFDLFFIGRFDEVSGSFHYPTDDAAVFSSEFVINGGSLKEVSNAQV